MRSQENSTSLTYNSLVHCNKENIVECNYEPYFFYMLF